MSANDVWFVCTEAPEGNDEGAEAKMMVSMCREQKRSQAPRLHDVMLANRSQNRRPIQIADDKTCDVSSAHWSSRCGIFSR